MEANAMRNTQTGRVKLPNGLVATTGFLARPKMRRMLTACNSYAAGKKEAGKVLIFGPDFSNHLALRISVAGTSIYLMLLDTIRGANEIERIVGREGFDGLFKHVMYFGLDCGNHIRVVYRTVSLADVLITAITQNVSPNVARLLTEANEDE